MLQPEFRNLLIQKFSPQDFSRLRPHFERVSLKIRETPVQANRPISHVYFPESGQYSMILKVPNSEPIEVGMFGVEGMSDMVPDQRTPIDTVVQLASEAHRIDAKLFSAAVLESKELADLTARYHRATLAQLAYTALSHGGFTVPERLARWLLMVHDRTEGDEIPLVQDFFSWMLAVRRAGVSDAFKELRSRGAVDTKRGSVIILDRDALVELASGSYGPAEAEYKRLLGMSLPRWDSNSTFVPP